MPQKRLGFGELGLTLTDMYITPANTVCRVETIRIAFGTAGNLTLKIENPGTTSHFLLNNVPVPANKSLEIRDLILEPGWKIRGLSSVAGTSYFVFGVEKTPVPANPELKVLAATTLVAGPPEIIYTVPAGKRASIRRLIFAAGAAPGNLTMQMTSGAVTANYRNQESFLATEAIEDFDIPLNGPGEEFLASGTGDLTLFGMEFNL